MKLFQSFWALPLSGNKNIPNNILDVHLYVMALSVVYAKMNGVNITMHTDDFGLQFVEDMPYDDIKFSLNEIPEWMPINMWACGKIFAQKHEPLGALHTDYDVFLKNEDCLKRVDNIFKKSDVIVQSNDSMIYCEPLIQEASDVLWKNGINISRTGADVYPSVNCGIVGFNNQILKDEYIKKYIEYTHRFSTEKVFEKYKNELITPDLIFEQKLLYQLSKRYKVGRLLESNFFGNEISIEATRIGYVHLISMSKKNRIEEVIGSLRVKDNNLYNKVTWKIKLLKKEYNYD